MRSVRAGTALIGTSTAGSTKNDPLESFFTLKCLDFELRRLIRRFASAVMLYSSVTVIPERTLFFVGAVSVAMPILMVGIPTCVNAYGFLGNAQYRKWRRSHL